MTVQSADASLGELVSEAASAVHAMRRAGVADEVVSACEGFRLAPGEVVWSASGGETDDLVALASALNTPWRPVFVDWYAAGQSLRGGRNN